MNEPQLIAAISSVGFLVLAIASLVARRPSMGFVVKSALIWAVVIGLLLAVMALLGQL